MGLYTWWDNIVLFRFFSMVRDVTIDGFWFCFSFLIKVIHYRCNVTVGVCDIHYMTESMWTPVCRTSQSKIMGINMELVPPLLLLKPPLFWEGFPLDVGTLLRGLASIQPQEH